MAKTNVAARNTRKTAEGGPALPQGKPETELRRAVSACLLWENGFYESGEEIAERIRKLVGQCSPQFVADLAVQARDEYKLRHAPLWLLACMMSPNRKPMEGLDGRISDVIRRADEPGELISLFSKAWPKARRTEGGTKDAVRLPAAFKRGIATALGKFDAYQLGKYNRKAEFSLKDVIRLVHPRNAERSPVWKKLIDGELESPDTWEVALSGGADKKATFERLITEGKLGYLALLRNLRKMAEVGVDTAIIREAIIARKGAGNVLPFRYVAAAKAAPQFEPFLDEALCASIDEMKTLPGETIVLVDVSPSMGSQLSGKSDMTRMIAAATLASIIPGKIRVFTFDENVREIAPRKGMAGVDAILRVQGYSTMLGKAVARVNLEKHDRLIVITDEETADVVPNPVAKNAYMINVAQAKNSVGYGPWTRITGFSENVLRYIAEHEHQEG